MSASTERKNRQTARSEGSYAKDINAQKEAAKKKKQKIRWIIVGVAIVVFFGFAIYLNSGALYRSLDGLTVKNTEVTAEDGTAIAAGERSFSVAECNYIYHMQYISLMNTYGDYASTLFKLDTSKPLDEQECPSFMNTEGKENYTWDRYFRDATRSQLKQLAAYEAYAGQHDIKLDDDDLKEIDDTIASIAETAKKNNYGSVSKFLAANYGRGCNESVARDIMKLQALAAKVQTSITDAETYTAEELAAKYDSVKDSYDKFTYSYYLVAAEVPEHVHSEDESEDEHNHASEPTDEAKAAAHTTAEDILKKLSDGSSLADAAKAPSRAPRSRSRPILSAPPSSPTSPSGSRAPTARRATRPLSTAAPAATSSCSPSATTIRLPPRRAEIRNTATTSPRTFSSKMCSASGTSMFSAVSSRSTRAPSPAPPATSASDQESTKGRSLRNGLYLTEKQ